jgi:hypothetical protein
MVSAASHIADGVGCEPASGESASGESASRFLYGWRFAMFGMMVLLLMVSAGAASLYNHTVTQP